ncbi:MAG: hypothetical protein EPN31_15615 [Castellaniella sp.]|uniref:hypothetical protein n=1 Tax=Castellaniella sp. TaxID=1955812 RepID=UPI0012139311|nr:hypothetical protein [Castellaniella sp.]TAN25286.1 MAG: hypothetical protein EPN31_15615 [Castellaniella sp.]
MKKTIKLLTKYRKFLHANRYEDTKTLGKRIHDFFKLYHPWEGESILGIPALFPFLAELPSPLDSPSSFDGNGNSRVKTFYREVLLAINEVYKDNPFVMPNSTIAVNGLQTTKTDFRDLRDEQGRSILAYTDDIELIRALKYVIGGDGYNASGETIADQVAIAKRLWDNENNGLLVQRHEGSLLYKKAFNKTIPVSMDMDCINVNFKGIPNNSTASTEGLPYQTLFIGHPTDPKRLTNILKEYYPSTQQKISPLDLVMTPSVVFQPDPVYGGPTTEDGDDADPQAVPETIFTELRPLARQQEVNHALISTYLSVWKSLFYDELDYALTESKRDLIEGRLAPLFDNIDLKKVCLFSTKDESNYTYCRHFLTTTKRQVEPLMEEKRPNTGYELSPLIIMDDAIDELDSAMKRQEILAIQQSSKNTLTEARPETARKRKTLTNKTP